MANEAKPQTEEQLIKSLYNEGKNLYQIALEVYRFDNEEAVERVRRTLGIMEPPSTRIQDEE